MLPRQQQKNFNFSWSSPVKGLFLAVIFIFSFSQLLVATTSIPAGSPVVITSSYTSSSNAVTVNGNVTSENGSTVTERGIVYGTAAAPTLSNNKIASGTGTGTFSAVTPTLSPGIYFFRAYATNSSGTSYGAELTTTICSPNLPTLLFKLSPPDITTSAIQGQPGIRTENFNTQATGEIPASGTVANGTYTKTGPADRKVVIEPNAVWGGTESQYLSLMTNAVLNITLTDPSRYLGFWWGGGDDYNRVTVFGSCGGNEIQLGQFTTSSVTNLLAGPTVTAVDGNSYPSASYRRANAFNEPFAFINLELSDPNVYFTRMEVTQSGGGYFEIDNITSGTVYGAASYTTPSAMTISSITAGGNLTVNFNAPSSNGGQPITNFEYSTNGGTNWVAASPVVTTSPLVISGLSSGTTYSVRIRAVNSIGYGPQSSAVNATPISVPASSLTIIPTANQTHTGAALTPAVVVRDGATTLTLGTDYTVAYSNNTNVGTATVTITGLGNYTGTRTQNFTITNWISRTSAADSDWYNVTYGNGLFVAIAGLGAGSQVMTSPDGIAWTAQTSPAGSDWYSVTYGNGLFVAVAFSGTNQVMTSPDGINWTARTAAAYQWRSVTYGNGLFVAVASSGSGDRVMTSPDGITWTTRTSAADNNWGSVTYGNGVFVAVSFDGTNRVMTSPDGITWTARTAAINNAWYGITYGKGLFVATAIEVGPFTSGSGNRVMTSPDGITWTTRTSAADNTWYTVTYANGLFVALSYDGANRVMTSTDGINWTAEPAAENNAWNGITYGNGLFVAVAGSGTGNRVMTSNAAVSRLTIEAIADQSYTGSPLTPAIVVKDGNTTLTLGTHYSVAYSNNTNVGTATVTITGMGNFSGTQTVTFSIAVPPPTITSFSPASGPVGTLVTITGTNLGTPTAFTIGGSAAIVISNTGTSLVGMVMPGAATGTISLTTAGGSVTSTGTFTLSAAPAPNAQQGAKLVGTGNTGAANQGYIVSISADGNTAIVGGDTDNSSQGAAWIYTRSGAIWSQQGAKLVGTGAVGNAQQSVAVSISADGNTAIVGGYVDNSEQGAAWIFTRSGTTWTQQGAKLVGTGAVGNARQGRAVSLSADGNTAIVSGNFDDSGVGAAWIFTRSGTTWSQQGAKLVGTGAVGNAQQGRAVSLSADGTTAIVGGNLDNSNQGAAWIFTRSGTSWSQQGAKLVGTGAVGAARQGTAVSLSADGTTAILGGITDDSSRGAVWVFTRSGATWTQQGAKLVGTGAVGAAGQGIAVSISADGNSAFVGGYNDNSNQGAAWVFTRSGTTWSQRGAKLVGTGNIGAARQGGAVSISADGTTAIVGGYQDNSIQGAAWVYTYVPPPPTITSATYNASTGVLVVTGTNLVATAGATNDIDVSKLSLTGEGGSSYTLTTSNVELTSATSFSITLNATDFAAVNQILNKNGTSSTGSTTYNIAAADNWNPAMTGSADLTGNAVVVSNVAVPTLTSATYDIVSGSLVVTGTNLLKLSGATNDIEVTKLTFTGQGGSTVTLTSNTTNVEITNGTSFTVSLGATDKTSVDALLNKNGTSSIGGTTYNLAAAEDWNAGADPAVVLADLTANGITVSNVSNVATITATGTLAALTTRYATASSNTSFSVSGVYLTNDIIVTAPSGFEVSVSPTSGFGSTVTLTQTSGTVSITTVYVRLKSNSTVAGSPYSGDVTCTSINAQTVNVAAVSSTVTALGLTITGVTASNKEYDANLTATLGGTATLVGVVTADQANVTLAGTATATFNNASVGTNKAVTITGYTLGGTAAGNYTVSQPTGLTANITAKAASSLTIDPIANQTYTGSALTPAIVVKGGATTLTFGTDYTVAYSNNTNVGTATVTITGMGIYTGTKTQTFSIVSMAVSSLTIEAIANQIYTGAAILPLLVVKDGNIILTLGTDYSLACSNNTNVGTATATITGMGIYTGTKTQTFTILPKAVNTLSIDPITNLIYTGAAITPLSVVKDGNTTLLLGTDYSVSCYNNTNAGTAKLTITGIGNYTGTKDEAFNILPKVVNTLSIDPITNLIYTGAAITPLSVVKDGNITLMLGTDYSVSCYNNTNAGTAKLTITGIGNYTGTKDEAFNILPKAVNTLSIDPITNLIYTGAAITPLSVVKDGNITLTLGTDYSVSCYNNTNAGTAKLTITGIGNYTSTKNENFNILPKALTIQANNASKIYGDANPSLSFTYSGLVEGDIEIDQVPGISTSATTTSGVGTYPVTLTGGSDPNYSLTLVEGALEVSPAPLSLTVNAATKIYGQVDPVYTYSLQGLKGSDTEAVLVGAFSREAGEDPSSYRISQGSISAGANYNLTITETRLQILKARVLSVTELTGVTTAWSKEAVLPTTVNLLAAHGQNFQVEVKWDKSKLNLLSRGTYSLTGTLLLPVGIENPDQVLAKIKVQVLPKPAPRDVTITNNTFVGSTTVFFIPVGAFVVNDPVDNIHVVSFLGEGYDNSYFYIKNNILYWNSAERAPGKTTFSILIRVTDRDGNTIDKFFEIKRTRPDFSTVTIYNTFTPNGDRFNDTWGVQEIRFYEGARISVYERGGGRVFYTENPDIRWDGTYNGKEMPIGSYFWVIQIEETGETRRGVLNLIGK